VSAACSCIHHDHLGGCPLAPVAELANHCHRCFWGVCEVLMNRAARDAKKAGTHLNAPEEDQP